MRPRDFFFSFFHHKLKNKFFAFAFSQLCVLSIEISSFVEPQEFFPRLCAFDMFPLISHNFCFGPHRRRDHKKKAKR